MLRDQLVNKVRKLDREMIALFDELQIYSYETVNKKLNDQTWSPIQVIDHLILSEKLSLGYCKKKLSFEPDLKKANFKTWVNGLIINIALLSPFKFNAPEPVKAEKLVNEASLEEMQTQWITFRAELLDFIQTVPEKYIDTEVYKHPFGLRMSLKGMLNFYHNHFKRHRKQLRSRI